MWLLSRHLFLSHLVLLFRPFDLITTSVVLFVLLVTRIFFFFWSLQPFLKSNTKHPVSPSRQKPPIGCKWRLQMGSPSDNCSCPSNQRMTVVILSMTRRFSCLPHVRRHFVVSFDQRFLCLQSVMYCP